MPNDPALEAAVECPAQHRGDDGVDAGAVAGLLEALVGERLDAADKATVIGEQASTWKDRPATRLEVSVEPGPLEDAPRMLKAKIDIRRIFWVASDGTPLGSETRVTFSARFLVISATGQEKGSEDYEVIGDRLVITREVEESTSSAMGEKGRNTTTTTISLRK